MTEWKPPRPPDEYDLSLLRHQHAEQLHAVRRELAEARMQVDDLVAESASRLDALVAEQRIQGRLIDERTEARAKLADAEAERDRLRATIRDIENYANGAEERGQYDGFGDIVVAARAALAGSAPATTPEPDYWKEAARRWLTAGGCTCGGGVIVGGLRALDDFSGPRVMHLPGCPAAPRDNETAPPPSGHGYGYECNVTPFAYCKLSKGHPGEHVASVLWPPPSGDQATPQSSGEGGAHGSIFVSGASRVAADQDRGGAVGDRGAGVRGPTEPTAASERAPGTDREDRGSREGTGRVAPASAGDKPGEAAAATAEAGLPAVNTAASPSEPEPGAPTLDEVRRMEYMPPGWTRVDSERLLPLPTGWRWLQTGEVTRPGDVMHDPRCEPMVYLAAAGAHHPMTDANHPVRRAVAPEEPGEKAKREFIETMKNLHVSPDLIAAAEKTPAPAATPKVEDPPKKFRIGNNEYTDDELRGGPYFDAEPVGYRTVVDHARLAALEAVARRVPHTANRDCDVVADGSVGPCWCNADAIPYQQRGEHVTACTDMRAALARLKETT